MDLLRTVGPPGLAVLFFAVGAVRLGREGGVAGGWVLMVMGGVCLGMWIRERGINKDGKE